MVSTVREGGGDIGEGMKLEKIVSEFRQGILGTDSSERRCYMVCCPLAGYLRCVGYEVKLVEGSGVIACCWLKMI